MEGFWGTDCSISWGPDNKTPVLWGRNDTTKASRRPFIYIYELPPQFDTWYNGYRSADRQVGTFMHERLLNSEYRTPNPATADLFFVPFAVRKVAHFQNAQWKFKGAWNYIQATWPYLERNQGRDHLQVLTGDYGPADHFGYGVGKTGLPPPMTNVILLEHNGNMKRGMFRKGHDVNLPPIQGAGTGFDHHFSPLFGIQKKMGGALNVRTAVWKLHQHTPGFSILDTKVRDYKQRMAESVFCLAPPGTGGDGWGRRMTLGALYGCIPVIIQDGVRQPLEELLPYDAFSVHVSEDEIPQLDKILRSFNESQIQEMQKNLACVAPRWLFSTIYGAY
eukprot:gene15286-18085_t